MRLSEKVPDKQNVFLSEVTITVSGVQQSLDLQQIQHPTSLSDYYDFALEEKVLGLGSVAAAAQ